MKPEEVSALARSGAGGYLEPEDVRAICSRLLALEAALVDCQPWAHVVEDYAADLGAALVTETPYPTVASMTPRAARNPQIRHADNCPGCIARRALEGDTP